MSYLVDVLQLIYNSAPPVRYSIFDILLFTILVVEGVTQHALGTHWNNNPCGLHHWPEWQYRPITCLKEEIRSRDDHRWETVWPQIARVTPQQQECQKAHMTQEIPVTRCTTFQRVRNVRCGVFQKHYPVSRPEVSIRALAWKHLATGLP